MQWLNHFCVPASLPPRQRRS